MASFASFIINLVNILGINLIFTFLFYFGILYFLIKFLLDAIGKKDEKEGKKDINSVLAFIISVSASLLLTTFTGFVLYTQYFVAFIVSVILVFFFFILLGAFLTNGKIFELIEKRMFSSERQSNAKYIPLIMVIFIILFALLAMYYAYQGYFLSITFATSPGALNYIITFNPYILFAAIFFVLIGVFLILSGTGPSSESEKQGGDKGKSG
jgi:small-conductance mechanosensitive channel